MKRRIFRHEVILVITAIVLTFLSMSWFMYSNLSEQMQENAKDECRIMAYAVNTYGEEYIETAGGRTSSRVTLIGSDGTVLYDSVEEASSMENHSGRPEFERAVQNGSAQLSRYSDTLRTQTFYYAIRLDNGSVLRLASTSDSVFSFIFSGLAGLILLILAILIVTMIFASRMTRKLVSPINELDLEHPMDNVAYDELEPLLKRIDQQQIKIREQVNQMKQNQEEYMTITEYMKDGLIVTSQSDVLSINRSAQELFGVTARECVNHNIITVSRNQELKEALDEALTGKSNERLLEVQGRIYQLLANPVRVNNQVSGAVILVLDVTEKQKAENMRKEFSANVSHELKTPLMSISGYAEIIENNMVKPEDIPKFAGRIHSEASRLSSLVEDIIKLSRLDESDKSILMEDVELYQLCKDVEGQLMLRAKERGIQLDVEGQPIVVHGARQILYEMVYNLCDNAIKYNKPDGKVKISVGSTRERHPMIRVEDTGIGIPKEEQQRVFERFYRVDKSHSRATGGTGLGLSIVKHGAILHDAKIEVDSTPDVGTSITLEFGA